MAVARLFWFFFCLLRSALRGVASNCCASRARMGAAPTLVPHVECFDLKFGGKGRSPTRRERPFRVWWVSAAEDSLCAPPPPPKGEIYRWLESLPVALVGREVVVDRAPSIFNRDAWPISNISVEVPPQHRHPVRPSAPPPPPRLFLSCVPLLIFVFLQCRTTSCTPPAYRRRSLKSCCQSFSSSTRDSRK